MLLNLPAPILMTAASVENSRFSFNIRAMTPIAVTDIAVPMKREKEKNDTWANSLSSDRTKW